MTQPEAGTKSNSSNISLFSQGSSVTVASTNVIILTLFFRGLQDTDLQQGLLAEQELDLDMPQDSYANAEC